MTDTKKNERIKKKKHIIVKSIHSSLCSESKIIQIDLQPTICICTDSSFLPN